MSAALRQRLQEIALIQAGVGGVGPYGAPVHLALGSAFGPYSAFTHDYKGDFKKNKKARDAEWMKVKDEYERDYHALQKQLNRKKVTLQDWESYKEGVLSAMMGAHEPAMAAHPAAAHAYKTPIERRRARRKSGVKHTEKFYAKHGRALISPAMMGGDGGYIGGMIGGIRSAWTDFLGMHLHDLKMQHPHLSHGEIMRLASNMYHGKC